MPMSEGTYDAIRDGYFLTLDEQIEALAEYLPEWDRTLDDLGRIAEERLWTLTIQWNDELGYGASATLTDWNDPKFDHQTDEYLNRAWYGKWNKGEWFYAAIRAFRSALNVPEYPQLVPFEQVKENNDNLKKGIDNRLAPATVNEEKGT